jgi:hypothetical protein
MFTSYVKNKDSHDTITFGDENQGKVKGLGKIAITTEHSISNIDVSIFRRSDGSLAFKGVLDDKLWQNHPNYSSLSAQVAPLEAATHLNQNKPFSSLDVVR